MTKEEIRHKSGVCVLEDNEPDVKNIENAMAEYAEQECIGFAEFIKDNSYTKSDKGWYQYHTVAKDYPAGYSMMIQVYDFLTIKQVYQIYLQSKNNQP